MDVAGGHYCVEHKAVVVAGGMCFIGKLPLVLALYE